MDFESFAKEIADKIKDFLPEKFKDSDISLNVVTKNNDVELKGLTITSPESNMSPTIYLNSFYERFMEDADMDVLLSEIARIRVEHEVDRDFDASTITNFDVAKDKIMPRLIDSEHNDNLLSQRPHEIMDGLAVIYAISLGEDRDGYMSVPVTNQLMKTWGVEQSGIHVIAMENLNRDMPGVFKSMSEVLKEMMLPDILDSFDGDIAAANEQLDFMLPPGEMQMYVLSNEGKINGATVLLNEDAMKEVVDKFGEDFYIIPSSVHECIIIPANGNMSLQEVEAMVMEVNATQVAPDDRLSDHVFKYDAETKEIYRADRAEEHVQKKEANRADKKPEKQISIADRMKSKKEQLDAQIKPDKPNVKAKETIRS